MSLQFKRATIEDLNDKTLQKIVEYLSLDDLCAIQKTCLRFRNLANQHFKDAHTEFIVNDLIFHFTQIERQIQCFGQFIKHMTINGTIMWDLNQSILEIICKHCQLTSLQLIGFRIDKSMVPIMKRLLQFIEKLELIYCPMDFVSNRNGFGGIFELTKKLKELTINCPKAMIDAKFLAQPLPNLQKLEILSDGLTDEKLLVKFLDNHSKLKHFKYLPQSRTKPAFTWWTKISNLPSRLRSFGLKLNNDFSMQMNLINNLNNLKMITVDCKSCESKSVISLILALADIDTLNGLNLQSMEFSSKLVKALAKLNNIETLALLKFTNDVNLEKFTTRVSKTLNQLSELRLDGTSVKNANDIETLIKHFDTLKNLYFCDVTNFYLMPDAKQLKMWRKTIQSNVKIFVDKYHLKQLPQNNCSFQFVPMTDRFSF